jgi:hypothetical protein
MARDLFTAEWFPYYFERFEGSDRVAVMSLAEEGAYHRAIRIAWKYGSVPADSALLAAKIGKRCTPKIADAVLRMFEPVPGNPSRMFHPTVENIRSEQQALHSRKQKGGLATAKKRWGYEPDSVPDDSSAIGELKQSDSRAVTNSNLNLRSQTQTDLKRLIKHACENFPKIDKRIVEIGVLYTMLQRNGSEEPIRSARYFDPEIRKMIKDGPKGDKALDTLLKRRREQWAAKASK